MSLYYFDSVRFFRPVTISLDSYCRLVPPMPSFLSLPSAVAYQMHLPPTHSQDINHDLLYIHRAQGRKGRVLDDSTEQFVEDTRMGTTA